MQALATQNIGGNNPLRTATRLIGGSLATTLAAAILLSIVLLLVNQSAWWRGLIAATIVAILSAICSLVPLIWGMMGTIYRAMGAYFVAAAVRAGVSIGGCLLAVKSGGYPLVPTFVLMVVFYLALLAAESTLLGKA